MSSDERVLLLIDFRNQVYRHSAANADLFSGRTFTGGLYGFITSVCYAIRLVGATAVVCATDTPPYMRNQLFGEYKRDRDKKKQDDEQQKMLVMKASSTMAQVESLCEELGIPVWALPGFEFDDICAWAAMHYRNRYTRIVAMTNDTDLYQLFDVPCFSIFKSAKQGVYTRQHFIEEWGALTRDQWVDALALMGTHNGVPGIKGVGPKTAIKAVTAAGKWTGRERLVDLMRQHGELIERNRRLITLPMKEFPQAPGFRVGSHRHIDLRSFARFVGRFDIQTTSGMLEALQDLRNNGH